MSFAHGHVLGSPDFAMQRLILIRIISLIGLSASVASGAKAGSIGLREQSTIGQGQDFAGVAAGSAGIGSMFWNPATLTGAPGWQVQANAAALFPYASASPLAGTSPILLGAGSSSTGDVLSNAILPSAYLSHQINDRWWFGLGVNSPYGVITKAPANSFGQIFARSSSVRSYDFNPNVAFKVTDWFSLGFGMQATLLQLKLSQAMSPLANAPSATLQSHSWGAGFTAGATLTPRDGTEIGVGYRSATYEPLHGGITIDGTLPVPARAPLHLPDQVTVGLRQRITPDLTLSGGYEWTQWSRLGTVAVSSAFGVSTLPFNYRDGTAISVGGEYRLNQKFTLRSGLGYEWSPITDDNRDMNSPDSDRVSVSAGFGYRVSDAMTLDLAYSHYFMVGERHVRVEPGNPVYVGLPLVAEFSIDADVASVGLTYRW